MLTWWSSCRIVMQRSKDIMHIHVCAVTVYVYVYYTCNTVDGRNPAPPGIHKTLYITRLTTNLNWLAGFLPSTVCTCVLVASTTLPFLETPVTPNLDCSENTPWVLAVSPAAGVPLHQRGSPHITQQHFERLRIVYGPSSPIPTSSPQKK